MGGLFGEKRENRGCHAQNHPRDEQGVNCKLNEVIPIGHTLPSARKGTEQESDSLQNRYRVALLLSTFRPELLSAPRAVQLENRRLLLQSRPLCNT
jgi:hypothetical protein